VCAARATLVSTDLRDLVARGLARLPADAVAPAMYSVLATSSLSPSGVWKMASDASVLITTKSAAARSITPPYTRSPVVNSLASWPTSSTEPAKS